MLLHQILCSLVAFALLCLAMERHHEDALGQAPSLRRRRALRGLALLAFVASTWTLSARPDWGVAWAEWTAQLSLAAFAVVALATWRPAWMLPVAWSCGAAALLLGALSG
ncbi:DUF3325 domain-containing protein [Roseateles sp. DAIF2]|uniref:DUF3325 domain-containing protein n=1 Tax=Roseateles sp. DAIF2 TaxID=2714952 RepID=UPI0018A290AD|nr:DUF3325 domain-containing protein [Roseateles sp. DAIF2]QPF73516.1 DUF3325 domain-containing protein [Roseateles sp. DAIF2]